MQVDVSELRDANGNLTWEAFNADADGDQRLIAVLLENHAIGNLVTDAYVTGDHGFVYCPQPGEWLNMLIGDVSGTGDSHTFGELLMADDGTGELVATTGSPESESFMLLETLAAPTADVLALCRFSRC